MCRFNHDAKALIDARDPNPRNVLLTGEYDPEFFRIARLFLTSGAYFDVGANFGLNTFGLLPLVSEAVTCHLFEANPQLCECLRLSAAIFEERNITVLNKAVADITGTLGLEINLQELGQSYISPNGVTRVSTLRLDDYISARKIKSVDLMKLDIEGYELPALWGAEHNMKSGTIKAIIFEVKNALLTRSGFSASNLLTYVANCGYRLFLWRAEAIKACQNGTARMLSIQNVPTPVIEIASISEDLATDVLAIR